MYGVVYCGWYCVKCSTAAAGQSIAVRTRGSGVHWGRYCATSSTAAAGQTPEYRGT